MDKDEGLIVEIPLDDMELGHDVDGLPKTVPSKRAEAPRKDDRVEALERERDARTAEAEEARQRATDIERKAADDIGKLKGGLTNAHYHSIVSNIAATQAQAEAAERDYAKAMESGDYNLASKAQRLMSRAEAALDRLEQSKSETETYIRQREATPAAEPPKREQPKPEPTQEDEIAQYPKLTQQWLRDHPEYISDKKLNAKLKAAAYEAEHAESITPHTSQFFEFLEQKLGLTSGDEEVEEQEPAREEKPKVKVVASAPVSRNGGGSQSNGKVGRIKLHPHLVRVAKEIGSDPAVYAAGVLKAIKDGKLPKNYLDPDYPHPGS